MAPRVSIIVPVHNAEKYLRQCLDSALSQSFGDFECLCVDDASTDASLEILREYEARDERIKVIAGCFDGPSATRNVALGQAAGEFIAFLDADDWWDERMLEKTVGRALETQADMVVFDYWLYYEGEARLDTYRDQDLFARLDGTVVSLATCPELAGFVGIWDRLFRKDLVAPLVFYDGRLYEDAMYCCEAVLRAKRIAMMADHLYYYRRQVEHSITYDEDSSRKHELDFLVSQKHMSDLYRAHGISVAAWREYARYFAEYAYMHQREVRTYGRFKAFFDVVREIACPERGLQLFELWRDDPNPWRNAYLEFVKLDKPLLAWLEAKSLNAAGRVLGRR